MRGCFRDFKKAGSKKGVEKVDVNKTEKEIKSKLETKYFNSGLKFRYFEVNPPEIIGLVMFLSYLQIIPDIGLNLANRRSRWLRSRTIIICSVRLLIKYRKTDVCVSVAMFCSLALYAG